MVLSLPTDIALGVAVLEMACRRKVVVDRGMDQGDLLQRWKPNVNHHRKANDNGTRLGVASRFGHFGRQSGRACRLTRRYFGETRRRVQGAKRLLGQLQDCFF